MLRALADRPEASLAMVIGLFMNARFACPTVISRCRESLRNDDYPRTKLTGVQMDQLIGQDVHKQITAKWRLARARKNEQKRVTLRNAT